MFNLLLFKVSKVKVSEMAYSESEPDFFNFVINSLSCKSESDKPESDLSSAFMNLSISVFLPYTYTLLNKLADDFFYQLSQQNQ